MASSPEEQMVKGRGARERSGGSGTSGAEPRPAGDGGSAAAPRNGNERRRDDGGERVAVRNADRDGARQNAPAEARDDNRPADSRAGNQRYAVPRGSYVVNSPPVVRYSRPATISIGSPYHPRYYAPYHYDHWFRSYYRWSPIGYVPWSLVYGTFGFSNFGFYGAFGNAYPYAPYAPYAPYSPWQVTGTDIGGVRLKIRPRDAQVFVDGYYAGLVDDFDGSFQSLRLEQGGHKIEIHMPGYEDLELDVHVQPGRTITLQQELRPRP